MSDVIITNLRRRVGDCDRRERFAVGKGVLTNLRHRRGDRDRRERGAAVKGELTNLRHRVGNRDRRERGDQVKGGPAICVSESGIVIDASEVQP